MLSTVSSRLTLSPLSLADLDEAYAVYSDPGTWEHLPSGRHTTPEPTRKLIERSLASLEACGVGEWSVRIGSDDAGAGLPQGTFIGVGGVKLTDAGVLNLGYRLAPASWGRGFATEVAMAALAEAAEIAPDIPVTARVLANNPASIRVIERLGLDLIWEGWVAASVPGPDGEEPPLRRVYSDRPLDADAYAWIVENA